MKSLMDFLCRLFKVDFYESYVSKENIEVADFLYYH